MATFQSIYNSIEYNVKEGAEKIRVLKQENARLEAENQALKERQQELEHLLDDAKERIKLITITETIINKEHKQEIKKQIKDWVQEIDKCINLLTTK
jgi:predicted nuclease with TOPRIM domain